MLENALVQSGQPLHLVVLFHFRKRAPPVPRSTGIHLTGKRSDFTKRTTLFMPNSYLYLLQMLLIMASDG